MNRPTPRRRRARRALLVTAGAALVLCGCSSASASGPTSTTTTVPATTTTTLTPEQPGWTTLSTGPHGVAIDEQVFTQPDGIAVTVARFIHGNVSYDLHIGSQEPPTNGATLNPQSGPAVSATEQPHLLACFNGGFKANAGVGGVEVNGTVLLPLKAGEASLVIDTDGSARIGVWGSTVPTPGEPVASVRQNLPPLILAGQPAADVGTWRDWGYTLGNVPRVPRSALGEDAHGNLLYAAAGYSLPVDLSGALLSAGATTAMQLDINPSTLQLDTAATPGAPLVARDPGQTRVADQCQVGWIRDFITVLSTG